MPEPLTEAEAAALVEKYGSQKAAAEAYGVPRHTFRYWLNRGQEQAQRRRRYRENPEPQRTRARERWENLSGLEYSRRLLQQRRIKALHRMAERKRRQEAI